MSRRVFVYGCFQDSTLPSTVAVDVNFGDRQIFAVLDAYFAKHGFVVVPVMPDDPSGLLKNCGADDCLVIGGGGLIHPNCINVPILSECSAAKKAVFGIGLNWLRGEPVNVTHELAVVCDYLSRLPFVVVRDWQTKALFRSDKVRVCPDIILGNWIGSKCPGVEKAIVVGGHVTALYGEVPIVFNKMYEHLGGALVRRIEDLTRFSRIRSAAYHGMLLSLCVNAEADVHFVNAKQDAFIHSFWDNLDVTHLCHNRALVKCKSPQLFYDNVMDELGALCRWFCS